MAALHIKDCHMELSASEITVRAVGDVPGSRMLQEVQRRTWGADALDILPTHILVTLAKNGGLVLGAFAPDGPTATGGMVGFVVGWLGTTPATATESPRIKHCSHIAGVLPEWQGRGIGWQLKLAQRQVVLEQGITEHVTWTYDPLYRTNGAFNLRRLGAVSTTYIRNIYGEMSDALNAGMPTDRCQVDWYLRSLRVCNAVADAPIAHIWDFSAMQIVAPPPAVAPPQFDGRPVALPLPDDIATLRRQQRERRLEWRLFLRAALEQAFAADYILVDCVTLPGRGWHYIVEPHNAWK